MSEQSGINVEIGPGENPWLLELRSDLIGGGGAFFVELNRGSATALKKDIDSESTLSDLSRVKGVEVARQVIIGDVRALPFPESSVNLVFSLTFLATQDLGVLLVKITPLKTVALTKISELLPKK